MPISSSGLRTVSAYIREAIRVSAITPDERKSIRAKEEWLDKFAFADDCTFTLPEVHQLIEEAHAAKRAHVWLLNALGARTAWIEAGSRGEFAVGAQDNEAANQRAGSVTGSETHLTGSKTHLTGSETHLIPVDALISRFPDVSQLSLVLCDRYTCLTTLAIRAFTALATAAAVRLGKLQQTSSAAALPQTGHACASPAATSAHAASTAHALAAATATRRACDKAPVVSALGETVRRQVTAISSELAAASASKDVRPILQTATAIVVAAGDKHQNAIAYLLLNHTAVIRDQCNWDPLKCTRCDAARGPFFFFGVLLNGNATVCARRAGSSAETRAREADGYAKPYSMICEACCSAACRDAVGHVWKNLYGGNAAAAHRAVYMQVLPPPSPYVTEEPV